MWWIWTGLALAEVPEEDTGELGTLTDLVPALAEEAPDLAAAVATHIAGHSTDPEVAARAATLREGLPAPRTPWQPVATLALWQGFAGSLIVPLIVWEAEGDMGAPGTLTSVALGGGLGVAGAILYAREVGPSKGRTTAIAGASQLGAWNGYWVSTFASESRTHYRDHSPIGVLLGGAAGLAGGYVLAGTDPDDARMIAAYSGAWWGLAFGVVGTSVAYGWDRETPGVIGGLVLATDLGVAGGYLLASRVPLRVGQIRLVNLGGLFGAAATYAFAWSTQDDILWTEAALASAMGVGALVGGAGGALAGSGALSRTRRGLAIQALPFTPAGPGLGLTGRL